MMRAQSYEMTLYSPPIRKNFVTTMLMMGASARTAAIRERPKGEGKTQEEEEETVTRNRKQTQVSGR